MASPNLHRRENHIQFLDGVRGVAILSVFCFHCFQHTFEKGEVGSSGSGFWHQSPWLWLLYPVSLGRVGVPIFFVVSGFCIHLSYVRSRRGWGLFFKRRFFRIYPPYLVALLFFSFIFPLTRIIPLSYATVRDFASHLFLLHNYDIRNLYGINGAFWSIAVEVQLYLIYPLLLFVVKRFGWNKSLGFLLITEIVFQEIPTICSHLGHLTPPILQLLIWSPFAYGFSWSIGARIADDWLENRPLFLSRLPFWIPCLCFVLSPLSSVSNKFFFLLGAIATGTFISRTLARHDQHLSIPKFLSFRHLRMAGVVSYSIYLLHEPLIELMPAGLFHSSLGVFSIRLLEWLPILGISLVFHRLVEVPSISLGKSAFKELASRGN